MSTEYKSTCDRCKRSSFEPNFTTSIQIGWGYESYYHKKDICKECQKEFKIWWRQIVDPRLPPTIFIGLMYLLWLYCLYKLWKTGAFLFESDEEYTKRMHQEMDKQRKKNKEVWHYACVNGHDFKSFSSPTSSYCADRFGMTETRCPVCGTTRLIGKVYINGKPTMIGAVSRGFIEGVTK